MEKWSAWKFIGGELAVHHPDCPCQDCGLDREVDAAFIASGMVSSAVAVETGAATVEEVVEEVDE